MIGYNTASLQYRQIGIHWPSMHQNAVIKNSTNANKIPTILQATQFSIHQQTAKLLFRHWINANYTNLIKTKFKFFHRFFLWKLKLNLKFRQTSVRGIYNFALETLLTQNVSYFACKWKKFFCRTREMEENLHHFRCTFCSFGRNTKYGGKKKKIVHTKILWWIDSLLLRKCVWKVFFFLVAFSLGAEK